jgi:hypothetical protein
MYGMLHDKPVSDTNKFPCNDSMILMGLLYKLKESKSYTFLMDYYWLALRHTKFNSWPYPIERVPSKKDPMPSRDFYLGAVSLKLVTVETFIANDWNFSPIELPKLNIFKLVYQLWQCKGKDRKYFWHNNLTQVYHVACMVPFQDREFYYRINGLKAPLIYRLIAAIDKIIKPKKNSAKFIRFLKYDYQPSLSDWLEKCTGHEDHPLYVRAVELSKE